MDSHKDSGIKVSGEIYVSECMVRTITLPVTVTRLNWDSVVEWCRTGKVVSITKKTGESLNIKTSVQPECGDIIERVCMDGDIIAVTSRSTDRYYRIRVKKGGHHMFSIHPSMTTSHNVDFNDENCY